MQLYVELSACIYVRIYLHITMYREKKIKNVKIYINAYKPPFNITKQIIFHLIYIIHKKNLNNLIFLDIYIEKKN